jgi:hypothetical protein
MHLAAAASKLAAPWKRGMLALWQRSTVHTPQLWLLLLLIHVPAGSKLALHIGQAGGLE